MLSKTQREARRVRRPIGRFAHLSATQQGQWGVSASPSVRWRRWARRDALFAFICLDAVMGRVDWVFLGGWMLLAFYVVGFWTLAVTVYVLLAGAL
jgi:hypothetical protein